MSSRFLTSFSLFVVIFLLVGCQNRMVKNSASQSARISNQSSGYDYNASLKHCIAESDYLAKKNSSKYGRLNSALLQMLSEIKINSSQLTQIDATNKEIISSMYVFQTNDLCNTISQYYLAEVKKDVNKIIDRSKIIN